MPFVDSFPVRARGPRTDLCFGYVYADIGASGAPTVDATKTSSGFSITRNSDGNYNLVFPKCRFCLPIGQVRPNAETTVTEGRLVTVDKDIDASTGTVVFVTTKYDGTEDADLDPVTGSEIVFLVLLGY